MLRPLFPARLASPCTPPKAVLLASLTASPPPPAAVRSALHRGLCVGRRVIARLRRASWGGDKNKTKVVCLMLRYCLIRLLSRGTLRRAPRSRTPSAVCRHTLRGAGVAVAPRPRSARCALPPSVRPAARRRTLPPPCRRRGSRRACALGRLRPRAPACLFCVYCRSND